MTLDTYTIVYLITNVFNVFIIHRLIRAFFEQRRSKRWVCVFSYFSYFVITSLLYLFVDIPFVTLLVNWCIFLGISLNYKASMLIRLLSSLYILIFVIIPEIIIGAWIGYFHYSIFTEGSFNNSLGLIAARLATYMEALLLYNFRAVRKSQKVKGSTWISSVLIPIMTFVLFVFIIQSEDTTQTNVIVAVVLIYLINITSFYLYDSLAASYIKLSEATVLEKERELYYNQCTMMQDSTNELRAFRHDLKNQLIGVSELMSTENYEEAERLVGELSGKLDTKMLFSTTGNIPIDSIINYKLQSAENEHIRVETEIAVPEDMGIDISDCITIFGNLLDNALYALREVNEAERFLKLKVVFDKGCLMIQCVNPYVTEVQYENGKIVSTKSNREEHGLGLKNIEAIAEKFNGCVEIRHENSTFVLNLLLYLTFDYKK